MISSAELNKLRVIRKRLTQWAYWCRQTIIMGLNFSSQSIILQMDEIGSTEKKLAPDNKDAEEIESAVVRLSQISPQQAKTLYIHYVFEGSRQEKIKKIGCVTSTYYELLTRAEMWVLEDILG